MNTYEQMLLNDESALLVGIIALIRNSIEGDESAKAELKEVEKVINFEYEISCDATFQPSIGVLQATQTFSSIDTFVNADESQEGWASEMENQYGIEWDDDFEFGCYNLEKWSHKISVDIDGLTEAASVEAKAKYEELCQKKDKDKQQESDKALVENLRKQLEEAEARLVN